MIESISVEQFNETINRSVRIKGAVTLNFGGCVIRVESNSENLLKKLSDYYGEFTDEALNADIVVKAVDGEAPDFDLKFIKKQPEPGKKKIKEEYADIAGGRIIKKIITGMVFLTGKNVSTAVGPCALNDNQIVNFINNRYIEWLLKKGGLLMHASGICYQNNGMCISGFSGAGKSTMALNMMRRGMKFISNDRVIAVKEKGGIVMKGIPKLPRVNPGTVLGNSALINVIPEEEREEYFRIPVDELWELEHKYDVKIDEVFGKNRFVLEAPMKSLVILNWKRGAEQKVKCEKVDLYRKRNLLPAFMKDTGLFFIQYSGEMQYDGTEEAYLKLFENMPVYEITGGVDFDEATEILIEIIEGSNAEKRR
ncbi:MAG: HprK-related kinase B [Candidatus Goldbacteria bacterium]|nr:HprK-related kinase B [Candidatus Goldiibacteriota bacterium]